MVSLDDVLELLAPQHRRYALYYLDKRDGPVAVEDLVRQVAEWEEDPSAVAGAVEAYERIEIAIQHNHLPKAAELEFVQYDRETGTVELTGSPPEFDALLSIAKVIERPENDA